MLNHKQKTMLKPIKTLIILLGTILLSSCALLDNLKPTQRAENEIKAAAPPAQWVAPLPHWGSLKELNQFWAQYQDPLLLSLISAAEKESVDLASAKTRIMQARAARVSANAALLPSLDGKFSASRAVQQPELKFKNNQPSFAGLDQSFGISNGATNTVQIGLEASWELDLFGKNAAALDASRANLLGAESSWHEARVSLAAEVATSYFDYRFCNQLLDINKADAASRHETARITDISVKAGFTDEGSGHLAHASDASAQQQVLLQQASCELTMKELVALTNIAEPDLQQKMQQSSAPKLDEKTTTDLFSITEVPAEVIAQRPDVYIAEQTVIAAAADLQNNKLQRYPSISLNGSIGLMRLSNSSYTANGDVWSLGPISITLPIFDGGKRKANVETGAVKLDETFANYRSKVRNAVKEVEQALVNLESTAKRAQTAQDAATSYKAAFASTEIKYKSGFANIIDLEETRRSSLQADSNIVNLTKERNNAWIALYRAAGGGWTKAEADKPLAINPTN